MPVETANKFLVFVTRNGKLKISHAWRLQLPLSKADALNLAAYLVTMSMATEDEWYETLEAIENK